MFDYNAIIAWAAVAATLIALITMLVESRRSRFSIGVDFILKLDSDFNSRDFKEIRKKAAIALSSRDLSKAGNEIDSIIDFFEGVAFYTKRGALDKETVWHFFFTYMYRFWHLSKDHLDKERKTDQTLWADYIKLYCQLFEIEKKECRRLGSNIDLTSEDLQKFLKEESIL